MTPGLVVASVLAAVVAGYVALDVARRATRSSGPNRGAWIVLGGFVMGAGIWSMHFIGMLALSLPVAVGYDTGLVALSMVAAAVGAVGAIAVVSRSAVSRGSLGAGAVFMGLAIAAMHYLGMASMQMAATISWSVPLIALSVAIGVGASWLALWLVFADNRLRNLGPLQRGGAAVVLGLAVSGLHYVAMAAAGFHHTTGMGEMRDGGVGTGTLVGALVVAAAVMFVVLIAGASADQRKAQLADELRLVADVVRDLARHPDARQRVCDAARELTGASHVVLLELDEGSWLRPSAGAGVDLATFPGLATDGGSTAAQVFADRTRRVREDVRTADDVDQLAHRLGVEAAIWEPVTLDERLVGLLVVAFDQRLRRPLDKLLTLTDLLGAEAAVAVERADLLDRLSRLAGTDDLTGLPNRRRLDDELSRALAHARRSGEPLTVALLDLDHFKAYNDAHGHLAGDRLLKTAAGSWQAVVRDEDVIGRWGGEEFLVLIASCELGEAEHVTERLRQALPEGTTCSAGVAVWDRRESADQLVDRCDRALYEAKAGGRDRAVVSD